MKSYFASKGKGLGSMRMEEQERGVPGPGELLIRVKATSLNYRELMIINMGIYPLPIKEPFIPLADGAGEVEEVGEGVTQFKPGDRVAAVVFPHWIDGTYSRSFSSQMGGLLDGMLTEYRILPEAHVLAIPDHLSWEEAAAYPCAGVTAWNALTGGRPLLPGETVLTMGTGGVSLFALQFAKLFGAEVIATTSSEAKAEVLRSLGADHVINYREVPDWEKPVRDFTGGNGVDHIIEIGGTDTLERSLRSVHTTGEINMTGWLATQKPEVNMSVIGATVCSIRRVALGSRRHHLEMNRAVALHKSRPVIDRVFAFEEAPEAFRYLAEGKHIGKVIITT